MKRLTSGQPLGREGTTYPIVYPECMQSLAQLISKFFATLTELHIPLAALFCCQKIDQCQLLTKLILWAYQVDTQNMI